MKSKKWKIDWKNFIITYFVSLAFTYAINYTIDFNIYGNYFAQRPNIYFRINIPISTLTIFIIVSYVFIINKLFNLRKRISKRILIDFIFAITLMFIQIVLSEIFLHVKVYDQIIFLIRNNFMYTNFIEIFLAILFTEFIYYVFKKKEEEIEVKKLIAENERYKYNQLKSQINPHFLFNSLNILAAIVYRKKDDESGEYIEKLSDVYRYVLTNEDNKVTKLQLEIEFINKYVEILKYRFKEGLIFDIDIKKDYLDRYIPTMSLQLLVENCIKHNISSKEHPLIIKIYTEENFIIVSNNKNIREEKSVSTGIGLNNLNQRYGLIANKSIEVIDNEDIYKVKIPLI